MCISLTSRRYRASVAPGQTPFKISMFLVMKKKWRQLMWKIFRKVKSQQNLQFFHSIFESYPEWITAISPCD